MCKTNWLEKHRQTVAWLQLLTALPHACLHRNPTVLNGAFFPTRSGQMCLFLFLCFLFFLYQFAILFNVLMKIHHILVQISPNTHFTCNFV